MTAKIGENIIGLRVPETDLELWDTRETPSRPALCGELRRKPELENLGLTFELVDILVGGHEARNVHAPAVVEYTDVVNEKPAGLCDLESLVGSLDPESFNLA